MANPTRLPLPMIWSIEKNKQNWTSFQNWTSADGLPLALENHFAADSAWWFLGGFSMVFENLRLAVKFTNKQTNIESGNRDADMGSFPN